MSGANGNRPAQTGFADVNGAQLYYEILGEGEPLVLVHRGLFDRRMWDDQFYEFARHYQVIRYDLRGSGKSPMVEGEYAHYHDLKGLLDYLKIDAANVIGQSIGGSISLDFALTYPKSALSLVLASSTLAGTPTSAGVLAYQKALIGALALMDVESAVEMTLSTWLDGPRRREDDVNPALRRRVRTILMDSLKNLPRSYLSRVLEPLAKDRLAEVDTPTLVLVGEMDVQDSHDIADLLATQIDSAGLVEMAGAGHMLNMEQPARFNQLVLDFLGG